jgi:hypothetical protein
MPLHLHSAHPDEAVHTRRTSGRKCQRVYKEKRFLFRKEEQKLSKNCQKLQDVYESDLGNGTGSCNDSRCIVLCSQNLFSKFKVFFFQQMHSLLKHKMLQLTAQHPVHTAHIATAQHNFNDVFLLIISTKTVTLARFRRMLPDDGPNGPKHVGAI